MAQWELQDGVSLSSLLLRVTTVNGKTGNTKILKFCCWFSLTFCWFKACVQGNEQSWLGPLTQILNPRPFLPTCSQPPCGNHGKEGAMGSVSAYHINVLLSLLCCLSFLAPLLFCLFVCFFYFILSSCMSLGQSEVPKNTQLQTVGGSKGQDKYIKKMYWI